MAEQDDKAGKDGMAEPATMSFDDLPRTLPIFPLSGVLLLPRGRLPLNIFEPRYLNMTRDALAGDGLIGMVQPHAPVDIGTSPSQPGASVYPTGCAGRITNSSETEDGRFLLTLTGIARFSIREEISTTRGYRLVVPEWQAWRGDLVEEDAGVIDRPRLVTGLKAYFRMNGITADWAAIDATPDERLVTSLSMICPFAASEKQALLEASDLAERGRIMTALIEMAALGHSPEGDGVRH
jgi:Lon protease-like protein